MKRFAVNRHSPAKTETLDHESEHETEENMKKILAIALLSVAITACESNTADNANAAKPANTPASTPTLSTPIPEASPTAKVELKAGDKVKVMMNGVASEATIVGVDEKAGKATVKIQGQKQDKTVAISDIVKQ